MQNFLKQYVKGDTVIWVVFMLLSLISVVEIYSATSSMVNYSDNYTTELVRHFSFLAAGAIIALFLHRMDYKWTRAIMYLFLPVSFVMLLLLIIQPKDINLTENFTLLSVISERNATRWIKILNIRFQPSEFAKIAVIVFLADLFSKDSQKSFAIKSIAALFKMELTEKAGRKIKFWLGLAVLGVFSLMITKENFSTGALLFGVGFLMMILGKLPWRHIIGLFVFGIIFLIISFVIIENTPKETLEKVGIKRGKTWDKRIDDFKKQIVNPFHIDDDTRQIAHTQMAISRGGLFGNLPGSSIERNKLPQAYDDAIFAIIVEELGLVVGILIILSYLILLYRAGIIAKKSENDYQALLALGLIVMMVLQAFVNIGVISRVIPVTGQPLPLLSRGGTSVIIMCMYIGIVQCVAASIKKKETILSNDKNEE